MTELEALALILIVWQLIIILAGLIFDRYQAKQGNAKPTRVTLMPGMFAFAVIIALVIA
jgi:hypothetical protein